MVEQRLINLVEEFKAVGETPTEMWKSHSEIPILSNSNDFIIACSIANIPDNDVKDWLSYMSNTSLPSPDGSM